VCKFECVSELFLIFKENLKKLTNTYKLIHRNKENTNKTSYLGVEEFHTTHALSFFISIYAMVYQALGNINNQKPSKTTLTSI
jgi:hypothetical protein